MDALKETVKALPHTPGIYIYKDEADSVIYVGKAKDLFSRVSQYFSHPKSLSPKTVQLVSHIHTISYIPCFSELDALLLEAKFIRQYAPKYNIVAKDDSSPIYILFAFEHDGIPYITLSRKPKKVETKRQTIYFGPFQSNTIALTLLRRIRKIIPFCMAKQRTGRPCFYTHIGLCNPCPSYFTKLPEGPEKDNDIQLYKKNILRLKNILSGRSKTVLRDMEKEMKKYAKLHQFEEANALKIQITKLLSLYTTSYEPFSFESLDQESSSYEKELTDLKSALSPYKDIQNLNRIECYDISNLSGEKAVGSMVVFNGSVPDKKSYRKFKIKTVTHANDVAMMKEVLMRRFRHSEWTMPNLVVVDGGKPQVAAAEEILKDMKLPIIGLSKRREEIICLDNKQFHTIRLSYASPALHLLQRIRDEAHRFAVSYHTLVRAKQFLLP